MINLQNKNSKGFTLVELIVVITILAILGTIAFISLQGYSRDSRDGARIADVNSVQKSLELYITEKGTYPVPDYSANITYSGGTAWIEGTVGDTVIRNLDKVNKKPLDPLTGNEYTYSITSGKTEYQLGAIKEGGLIGYELPLNQTYAANTKKATAMIRGNYNERFLKIKSGSLNWILAVPTIITADIRELDLQGQLNNKLLVYGNYSNLPHSYNNLGFAMTGGFDYTNTNPLVYSGSMKSLLEDDNKLIFIDNLKEAYNGTIIQGEPNYQDIVSTNTGTNQTGAIYLVNNLINTDVGGINPGSVILPTGNNTLTTDTNLPNLPFVKALGSDVNSVIKDSVGNIYVGGNFQNSMTIGATTVNSNGSEDCFIIKYDNGGNILWYKTFGSINSEYVRNISLDNAGNLYIGGSFQNTITLGGGISITSNGFMDGYIIKYNSSGNALWAKNLGGTASEGLSSLSVGNGGNIYVGGTFQNTMVLGAGISLTGSGSPDGFVAKYDSSGNAVWARQISGTSDDGVDTLSMDSGGNIYIGGTFYSPSITIGSTTLVLEGGKDGYIAKYDNGGNVLWTKKIAGTGYENIYGLKVDSTGNIYVGGEFQNTITIGTGISFTSNGGYDGFLAKYDSSGNAVWARGIGGTSSDSVYSLAFDTSGNIYIGGGFQSTSISAGLFNLSNVLQPSDSFVAKYDSLGNVAWLKRISSEKMASNIQYIGLTKVNAAAIIASDSTYINSVFVDNNGYVYLGGNFSQKVSITVGGDVLYGNGSSISGFAIKYNSDLE